MVTDNSGAVIVGVSVSAENVATGITAHTTTRSAGQYDFPFVPPGDYTLTFTAKGFQRLIKTGIVVQIATISVDATLNPGTQVTTVTVTQQPALIDTQTPRLSTTFPSHIVTSVPLVGGYWYTVTQLLPGAAPAGMSQMTNMNNAANSAVGENLALNGSQAFTSNYLIDGGSASFPIGSNPDNLAPPADAIQEVQISTGNFGAESGNGQATFNVILKSGTNHIHGTLYEFNQNTQMNAAPKNWSSLPQPTPAVHFNMFGGSVGGPIVRNRLFFFFAYQRNPTSTPISSVYTFPTAAMRDGNFSASSLPTIYDPATTTKVGNTFVRQPFSGNIIPVGRMDPVALKIQQFFPLPNAINPSHPEFNNYQFSSAQTQTTTRYLPKIDGNLSPNNHLAVSGLYFRGITFFPSPDCPIDCWTRTIDEQTAQISETWTISQSLVNEVRFSYANSPVGGVGETFGKGYPEKIGMPNLPMNFFPGMSMSSGPSISIGTGGGGESINESALTPADVLNWVAGKHSIKLGFEYNSWWDGLGYPTASSGNFNFSGFATRDPNVNDVAASHGLGYADFLLGGVSSWHVVVPKKFGGRVNTFAFFGQDAYRLFPNLTLNYGVRFLIQNGWKIPNNEFANYDATLLNPKTGTLGALAFGGVQIPSSMQATKYFASPRVGFAWQWKPSWVLRGGYGIYPLIWSGNGFTKGRGTGFSTQGSAQSTDQVHTIFQLVNGNPPPVVPTPETRVPSLLNGQNVTYSPYHMPIQYMQQYQLSVAHQFGNYSMQLSYVGNVGRKLFYFTDANSVLPGRLGSGVRPNPTYQSINSLLPTGNSNYNSLQVTAKRQLANGLLFLVNYTWAKTLDTGTYVGASVQNPDYYQNAYSTASNYGPSSNNVGNSVNGTAIYQLPLPQGQHSLLYREALGGWKLGGLFQANSGTPFTPTMAANLSGALSGNWYPNRVGSIHPEHQSVDEWFNVAAFTSPTPFTFGDSSRNSVYGPHYVDVDMNLGKAFGVPILGEAGSFEVRADVFDVFNHPNYGQPNSVIGSSGAGTISSSGSNRMIQLNAFLRF